MTTDVLSDLAVTIKSRRKDASAKSYTRELLDGGVERCAKKFGEEAVELVISALKDDPAAVTAEAADTLYHLLVLLEARGVPLDDVLAVLAARQGTSGLAEKAARTPKS